MHRNLVRINFFSQVGNNGTNLKMHGGETAEPIWSFLVTFDAEFNVLQNKKNKKCRTRRLGIISENLKKVKNLAVSLTTTSKAPTRIHRKLT